jgi:PAS domain-containing protein
MAKNNLLFLPHPGRSYKRLMSGNVVRNLEAQTHLKNGEIRTSLVSAELIEIDGKPCVLAIKADITDLKRAEATLREREEHFRLAMNNVAGGLYTLDLHGLVTYVNPAAESMFGWTNAELRTHDPKPVYNRLAESISNFRGPRGGRDNPVANPGHSRRGPTPLSAHPSAELRFDPSTRSGVSV